LPEGRRERGIETSGRRRRREFRRREGSRKGRRGRGGAFASEKRFR